MSAPDRHDVILVLGAAQRAPGVAGPAIDRRVRHAAALFHAGAASAMLLCGGRTRFEIPEALTMADAARAAGVPDRALHLEDLSTTTLENAIEARKEMAGHGWRRGLLVTDGFHMRRALFTFRALGMAVNGDQVRASWSPVIGLAHIREFAARLAYTRKVRRYLKGDRSRPAV